MLSQTKSPMLIGGSGGGGGVPAHAPPTGPNSFMFTYIFTEKCPRWRPKPPQNGSTPPLQKILDLALMLTGQILQSEQMTGNKVGICRILVCVLLMWKSINQFSIYIVVIHKTTVNYFCTYEFFLWPKEQTQGFSKLRFY